MKKTTSILLMLVIFLTFSNVANATVALTASAPNVTVSTPTEETISWPTPGGVYNVGSTIVVKVKDNVGNMITETVSACAATTTAIAGGNVTFAQNTGFATFTFTSTSAVAAASFCINVPALTKGVYTVTVAGGAAANDAAAVLLYVGNGNEVLVSADIDPILSMSLDTYSCDLGTLDTASVKTCAYTLTQSTNSSNGFTTSVMANGNLQTGANVINDLTDSAVTASQEEYGFRVTSVTGVTAAGTYGSQDMPVPTSLTTLFSTSSPVMNALATITHSAAISNITPVGHYTQTVTYTTTATF